MSYAADMNGLELFTMPFRSPQVSMAVPVSDKLASRSRSTDSRTVSPVQRPKAETPTEQSPDISEKSVLESSKTVQPMKGQDSPAEGQTSIDKPESPKKEFVMDMSDHTIPTGKPLDTSEDARRKAHEEAEAERKAKWEERQREKQEKEQAALQRLQSMSDADVAAASTECIRLAIERITRRNMKECVAGHIQEICQKSPGFARCVMHPRKSLANCFRYINRQAKDYLKNEMEENGIVPENGGYGGDVPDESCYQWAEEYFRDPDAPEDRDKEDEFVPRAYVGRTVKKKAAKKSTAKKGGKKKQETTDDSSFKQMSLEGIDQ